MSKVGNKILLLLAVFTVIAHSILPHIHLDEIVAMVEHHHHHQKSVDDRHHEHGTGGKEDPQNLFSFAQLDEDFIPSKSQVIKFELPVQDLSPVSITSLLDHYPLYTKKVFGRYKEYPPPDNYFYNLPSRAPPVFI